MNACALYTVDASDDDDEPERSRRPYFVRSPRTEPVVDTRLVNDMIDVEYATLAAYGSGLVSEDAGAVATYGDILAVAERLWG